MADDWFDAVGQPSDPERSDASRAQGMPDNGGNATTTANSRKQTTVTTAAVLGLVVLGAGAVAYLVNDSNDTAQQAHAAEASPAEPEDEAQPSEGFSDRIVPEDPEAAIGVTGQCSPQDGEVEISTDEDTVRGAVAQWQTAYYNRDAEQLTESIAPGSWLLENDWPTVLEEAAPEGTSWCAVMAPTTDNSVDVDVIVTFPDGDSETYPQTVTGIQDDSGNWSIYDIITRED